MWYVSYIKISSHPNVAPWLEPKGCIGNMPNVKKCITSEGRNLHSLKLTGWHLKIDGWKTSLILGFGIFSGTTCWFQGGLSYRHCGCVCFFPFGAMFLKRDLTFTIHQRFKVCVIQLDSRHCGSWTSSENFSCRHWPANVFSRFAQGQKVKVPVERTLGSHQS